MKNQRMSIMIQHSTVQILFQINSNKENTNKIKNL